jgi:uncharacterized protein
MLSQAYLSTIQSIVHRVLPSSEFRAFIFGSQAIGTGRKYSDIDIGIEGQKLTMKLRSKLKVQLEESNLPYKFDIVDFTQTDEKFISIAKAKIILL